MSTVTPHEPDTWGPSDELGPSDDPVGTVTDEAPDKADHDVNDPWVEPSALPESFDPLVAVAAGTSEPLARFRYDVATNTWWWSAGMFALHGFETGEVDPSTDLLLAHKHPEDLLSTEDTLRDVLTTGEPFCCRHRVVDARGRTREVLSVGEGFRDDDGKVVAVQGYFVDLTAAFAQGAGSPARTASSLEMVIALEQAKGILIGAFRLTASAALELLRWRSEETGEDVGLIAQGLVTEFVSVEDDDDVSPARRACTYLGLKPLEDD